MPNINVQALEELTDKLLDCLAFLDNYADVVDGPDGEPRPNEAMILASELRSAMERVFQ